MCRLMGMTGTRADLVMRRLFFHQLMLASVADDGQTDGAGYTDGNQFVKSGRSYLRWDTMHLQALSEDSVWMGHVRRASRHTALDTAAAHPYVFPIPNGYLFAAHNGTIYGTGEQEGDDPDVDSYRAFKRLATLMQETNGEVSADLINAWTAGFARGSEWTCMFMTNKNKLWIARGVRPMVFMTLNGGLVFNTSWDVMVQFKNWVRFWGNQYEPGKITAIAEHSLVSADLNSQEMRIDALRKPVARQTDDGTVYHLFNPKKGIKVIK